MTWRDEVRRCACGESFSPKREAQAYCTKRCANAATQRRKRSGDMGLAPSLVARSGDTAATPHPEAFSDGSTVVWSNRSTVGLNPDGSTPGALPGNYPLDYDENGFPELPACLDRREPPALKAAA